MKRSSRQTSQVRYDDAPRDRAFKPADLVALLHRYIPPHTSVTVTDAHMPVFETAFTHRSANQDASYERTEFLGDSISTAVLSSYIYRRFAREDEAFMTRLRAYLMSGKVYAELARQIGLPAWLRLGRGQEHLRARPEVQEDVYEAFVGALFLCLGYECTEAWVVRSLEEHVDVSEIVRRVINPRERLANFCVSVHGGKPRVEVMPPPSDGGSFVAKVFHPATGDLVAEGHADTATRAVGEACELAMDAVLAAPISCQSLEL